MKILDTLGKSKKAIGGVIAIIVLVIAIFFAGVHYASGSNNDKITSTTIKNQLTEINELALYSYDYSKVGKFSNKLSFNGWKIPLTQKTFIITYNGSIKAGIDLKQAKISIDNDQLNITLPAAKILSLEKKHTLECGFQAICYLFVTYLVHFILFLQAKNYSPNTSLSCNKISGV